MLQKASVSGNNSEIRLEMKISSKKLIFMDIAFLGYNLLRSIFYNILDRRMPILFLIKFVGLRIFVLWRYINPTVTIRVG